MVFGFLSSFSTGFLLFLVVNFQMFVAACCRSVAFFSQVFLSYQEFQAAQASPVDWT